MSAVKAGRYEWRQQPFRAALEMDLLHVEREYGAASLDGRVESLVPPGYRIYAQRYLLRCITDCDINIAIRNNYETER